jgi:hypothetical protein
MTKEQILERFNSTPRGVCRRFPLDDIKKLGDPPLQLMLILWHRWSYLSKEKRKLYQRRFSQSVRWAKREKFGEWVDREQKKARQK